MKGTSTQEMSAWASDSSNGNAAGGKYMITGYLE